MTNNGYSFVLHVINDPPSLMIPLKASFDVLAGNPLSYDLTKDIYDPEGAPLTFIVTSILPAFVILSSPFKFKFAPPFSCIA